MTVTSPSEPKRFAAQPPDPFALPHAELAEVVARALAEDVGDGDLTTDGVIASGTRCRAELALEEAGVVCGLPAVAAVFAALDPDVRVEQLVAEGTRLGGAPSTIARVEGSARAVLAGERVALNLLGRLCGIATLTAAYVERIAGTPARILDTRKTTPGLRALERYAVRCGGGENHRFSLDAAILLKENHLRLAGGIGAAVAALGPRPGVLVEVEAETLAEVGEAVRAGVGRILLDNMTPAQVRDAVALVAGRTQLEASGGIGLDTVRAYAEAGVDYVSVGALTRSARSLEVALEVEA
jgi:nicotinate-nucleotide pyrophosphorylase (carboxylating)